MRTSNTRRRAQSPSVRLGQRVRALRIEAGLSQEALAERAALHTTYLSSLERGHRNPTLNTIIAIAAALKLSAADLVEAVD